MLAWSSARKYDLSEKYHEHTASNVEGHRWNWFNRDDNGLHLAIVGRYSHTHSWLGGDRQRGGAGGGSVSGGVSGGGSGSGGNQSLPPSNETLPEATAIPTLPLPNAGPYVVKQIESLGGEVISGQVCSLSVPFFVNSATSKVAWVFNFIPKDANHGILTYAYSIPSAGESHNATGSYTISPPDKDGTLHLSLSVSDHVTFKGFDGNIPVSYKFDLVPSGSTSCPPTP